MREFKFRAWDGIKMFNVDVLAISECGWGCSGHKKRGVSLAYQPSIKVMQFTGITDSCGTPIFEKDIISVAYSEDTENNHVGIVKFYRGSFGTEILELWQYEDEERNGECTFKVIGNIHETPQLID